VAAEAANTEAEEAVPAEIASRAVVSQVERSRFPLNKLVFGGKEREAVRKQ
jgi:hypothetical protein